MENTVELLGYYGGDITHGCSAWTSTSRDLTPEKLGRLDKMLTNLAENEHHTPFEKSALHFLVTTDIASHIHIIKHRIGVAVNGESARYKEIKEDKFYLPPDWPDYWKTLLHEHTLKGLQLYHSCLKDLTEKQGMDRKRAKETARYFRGYNTQITADVMFNFRSFMHFLHFRLDDHAQKEIQDISRKMLDLVKNIEGNPFKLSLEAFGYV